MKLLFCYECGDIKKLKLDDTACWCKKTTGKYIDDFNVVYKGPGCILGIPNSIFVEAIQKHKYNFIQGNFRFDGYVLHDSHNITKLKE